MSCKSDEDLEPVNARKKILDIIEWSVQAVLFVWLIILFVFKDSTHTWNILLQNFQIFYVATMAMIVFISAWHIHKNSKPMERLGIKTNSPIMTLYIVV